MTCFLAKDIDKEFAKENDMMLLISDKETRLEQLEDIIAFKKQIFTSEEWCYLLDRHGELAANMLNKRPFVFNIVGGYELNKIRNFGIAENQELLDRLRGMKQMKSKLWITNTDEYGYIVFSDADNREDALKQIKDAVNNVLGWTSIHLIPPLEDRVFPYLHIDDFNIDGDSRKILEKLNAFGIVEVNCLSDFKEKFEKAKKDQGVKVEADETKPKFYLYSSVKFIGYIDNTVVISTANSREEAIAHLETLHNLTGRSFPYPILFDSSEKDGGFPFVLIDANKQARNLHDAKITWCGDNIIDEIKKKQGIRAEIIGEENKDSNANCSRCGRANTWHPDCPTCKRIYDLEQFIVKLSYFALCVEGRSKRIDEIVIRHTLEALNITEKDLINQHARLYNRMINIIVGRE